MTFIQSNLSNAFSLPKPWIAYPLPPPSERTAIDGDTFTADLDQDGKLEKPEEWIRLLYIDTPELSESHKGQNLEFGLPAKAFLQQALQDPQAQIWIHPNDRYGRHGRTLAVLESKQQNVNLALIREGHSYFDTRFSHPLNYEDYSTAEVEAFHQKRGIWSQQRSRANYLKRLQREHKTIRTASNDLWIAQRFSSHEVNFALYLGKYIQLEGVIQKQKVLSKKKQLWHLKSLRHPEGLPIIIRNIPNAYPPQAKEGQLIYTEGFVVRYQNHFELQAHRTTLP